MTDSEVRAAERLRVAAAALAAIAVHQGGTADEPWRITVETAGRMDGWFREAVAERDAARAELADVRGRLSVWATRVRMLAAHSVPSPTARDAADDMDAAAREGAGSPDVSMPEATGHDKLTPSVETHGPTLRSSRRDR